MLIPKMLDNSLPFHENCSELAPYKKEIEDSVNRGMYVN